ncbi:DUF2905 domain-containing protein [Desulfurobacterium atlanticum]|uniref:DUF2905 domain-containing protein n=1 Tax=Desulfurobacterium atlanticum TaxID=240169 RepID=A0A238XMX5_9BACT|nr:DUF2905 domain-containing protein [Desulfurobacterium atlanticum]SNR60366.1 Protein of unknown function [Desulfurobacterium atlanticum]
MEEIGKMLLYFGLMIAFFGFLLILISKLPGGFPLGRLPGDIYIKRDNFVFYFPITTSILISIIISLIFYLLSKVR